MKTYIWAQDTGHAWLAVKKAELEKLKIQDKITEYSFVKGSTVYLEEDKDATTFINAYTQAYGTAPKTKEGKTWDRNPCRGFARYAVSTTTPPAPAPANLKQYIDQRSAWMQIFNKQGITFPLSQEDANSIAQDLDGALSPENLHCDGEISNAEAQRKYRFYATVYQELDAYCQANALNTPQVYEL